MPNILKPFQLLEVNIISGQDLELVSKKMRTYATAWVHPKRKLSTVVDTQGHNNPSWNEKFVFRVDEEFLRLDTAAVTIEIYAESWFRDTLVGTVHVLVGNLIPPPPSRPRQNHHHHHHHHGGMRFAALLVRRPSGRPQGLLNIGVAVLDSSMRSMPLYTQLSRSALGYRDLMGQENQQQDNNHAAIDLQLLLRRSRSERTESVTTFDDLSATKGSIVGSAQKKGPSKKAISLVSDSDCSINVPKGKNKKGKASSVISGAELIVTKPKEKGRKGTGKRKGSSLVNFISSSFENAKSDKPHSLDPPNEKVSSDKPDDPKMNNQTKEKLQEKALTKCRPEGPAMEKPVSKPNDLFGSPKGSSVVNGKYIYRAPPRPHSFWSDSDVGLSTSEVAAGMASEREKEMVRYPFEDNQSSVLDGWSVDESMEGLRSKLERWRTELPPLYDREGIASSTLRSTNQHILSHSDDGGGLFSCFGSINGYEFQCVCGKPPERKRSLSFSDRL